MTAQDAIEINTKPDRLAADMAAVRTALSLVQAMLDIHFAPRVTEPALTPNMAHRRAQR